jgi:Zn-dependent peptidase ImmA (M78 family)/transcriptional regulator with XRE-family HTH domain
MQTAQEEFNPARLTLAREALGLTQTALSSKASISQSKISKIEDGSLPPTSEDVSVLARELGQPEDFFYRPGEQTTSPVSFYRKTNSLSLGLFKQCNARMNICRLGLKERLTQQGTPQHSLPLLPVSEHGGAEGCARKVRSLWGVKRGPIGNLTQLAEKAGCVVIHFDFPTKKLDGLSLWSEGDVPFIFLNHQFPSARMRLTLAHEIGHLVMHRAPHDQVEDEAWAFASELLMPETEIRTKFFPATLESLAALKPQWGVSMQALLKRGEDLGKIQPRYARYLWMQMGKSGYRIQEPYDDQVPREEPTRTALI